ncbi:hypothetical protein GGH96_003097 [Coemansia sp. RSA 1972]|nr:hypothetical protein GGH96_003097 [Coemansia sp. RSA 1972]
MKIYGDLPTLVTDRILAFAFSGADSDFVKWKQALPLLSVCRDWRVQRKYFLYRHAIIELVDSSLDNDDSDEEESNYSEEEAVTDSGGSDWESVSSSVNSVGNAVALDGSDSLRAYTNIKLIEKLGLESMVNQLLFGDKRPEVYFNNRLDSIRAYVSILQALFHNMPEGIKLTEPFIKWFELEYIGTEPNTRVENQCYAASDAAADILLSKYPNVSNISTLVLDPHDFFQKLIVELAVGYDKQLTKFVSTMPASFPYTLTAPNLVDLDLRFGSSSHQNLPTIFPQSLRRINISLENVPFSWDVFCADMESEAIKFNNLVDLSITGVVQVSGTDNVMNANNLDLVFPKLKRLYLENVNLTRKDAEAIMGHGLKRFSYVGSIISASQLCKQPLRNLNTLNLVWLEKQYSEEADDFVSLTNEIFNKTDGIEHVHCEIRSAYYDWNMVGIDWPYLTHLSLGFMMPFKELFDMLPKVPNLVCLEVNITKCIDREFAEATEFLTNIKKHYPAPSSSKITTLCLAVEHDKECLESCCPMLFGGAIENLKWYWPQLKDIIFRD